MHSPLHVKFEDEVCTLLFPSEDELGQSRYSICWLSKQLSHFAILNR